MLSPMMNARLPCFVIPPLSASAIWSSPDPLFSLKPASFASTALLPWGLLKFSSVYFALELSISSSEMRPVFISFC